MNALSRMMIVASMILIFSGCNTMMTSLPVQPAKTNTVDCREVTFVGESAYLSFKKNEEIVRENHITLEEQDSICMNGWINVGHSPLDQSSYHFLGEIENPRIVTSHDTTKDQIIVIVYDGDGKEVITLTGNDLMIELVPR